MGRRTDPWLLAGKAFPLLVLVIAGAHRAHSGEAFRLERAADMIQARDSHAATLLPDGRVLITGGSTYTSADQTTTAELYDPKTGTFVPTGRMHVPRNRHSTILLDDGRVLVAGGWRGSYVIATETAELYEPSSGRFTLTGPMTVARADAPPLVRLPDGRILVPGGTIEGTFGMGTAAIDVFDPVSATFSRLAELDQARGWHSANLVSDGTILVTGGGFRCCGHPVEPACRLQMESFDPRTLTSRNVGARKLELGGPALPIGGDELLMLSPDGRREIVNGVTGASVVRPALFSSVDIYGSCLLRDGRVLVHAPDALLVLDPRSDSAPVVIAKRWQPGATLTPLRDGRVLIAGGNSRDAATTPLRETYLLFPEPAR